MKKILLSVLVLALFNVCSVNARPGDIAGVYYSTDILTTLNGEQIDAINIGGETLISAEDMCHFGFSVVWDGDARTLNVYSLMNSGNGTPPPVTKPDVPAGEVIGNYYETDIVTYLDSTPITAYNIGGRTYIHAEEMRNFGYKVDWIYEKWTLSVTSPQRAGYIYSIPLYYGKAQTADGSGYFSITVKDSKITGTGDADYFDLTFSRNKADYGFTLAFYQNQGLFYSGPLMNILDSLSYDGLGIENPSGPEEKYDDINRILKISVNGQTADKIEIYKGGGNGHRDYNITVKGLPGYTKEEIKELSISLGEPQGEAYEIQMN